MAELSKKELAKYCISYGNDRKLTQEDRLALLQNLQNANVSEKYILTKGSGTQIILSDLSFSQLQMIYNFIKSRKEQQESILQARLNEISSGEDE
jgi:predicted rRNA methylase YqxC with S4 and FtsJ domains